MTVGPGSCIRETDCPITANAVATEEVDSSGHMIVEQVSTKVHTETAACSGSVEGAQCGRRRGSITRGGRGGSSARKDTIAELTDQSEDFRVDRSCWLEYCL